MKNDVLHTLGYSWLFRQCNGVGCFEFKKYDKSFIKLSNSE